MKINATAIAAFAFVGGFKADEVTTATAIALAESGGDTAAKNASGAVGLWQILPSANADIIKKESKVGGPTNPIANARMAHDVYARQGWSAWAAYTSGAYRKFMPQAKTAEVAAQKNPIMIAEGNPDLWKVTGQTDKVSQVPNVPGVPDVTSVLGNVSSALSTLTSSATWLRIGAVIGAVLLVLVGVVFMVESNKSAQSATKLAALA